jgi:hypothetical protein
MSGFRTGRRLLLLLVACATVATGATGAPAATAAPAAAPAPPTVIGAMSFGYLPAGLGAATDFSYDYDEVDFAARVWESRSPTGGWRVDLDLDVMIGPRLSSGRALHDWFIDYEQRDPTPRYRRVSVHGRPGWLCRDQIFWLVRPGLAVSAQLDAGRWPRGELRRLARAARPVPTG